MNTQTIVILLLLIPLALLVLACIGGWKTMSPRPQERVEPQKSDTGTSQARRPLLHRGNLVRQQRRRRGRVGF
jgi:hypothetical protein